MAHRRIHYNQKEELFVFYASGPQWFLPEDVLPDSRESWDVLVMDDVGVQRRLRHQVRPGQ